ncbi:MAG TPA: ABC transporter permease [Gemmatimonadales bacterium]|jgi:predicted permease
MSALTDLFERIRMLVFRRREERELHDELAFHVAMETEQKRRDGLDSSEARRQTLAELGGIERTKEEVREARGTRGPTDLVTDVRYGLRALRQRPAFSVVAILTIAIGIGATTAVFSALDTVLLQALPFRDPGQLVRLYSSDIGTPAERSVVSPVHYLAYRNRLASMQSIAALNMYDLTGADVGSGDDVERVRTLIVSSDYFDVLRVRPVLGHAFERTQEDGVNSDNAPGASVVIVSDHLWRTRLHANPAAIGTALEMNGRASTVVGVMPAGFADPLAGPHVDAWIPLDLTPGKDLTNANNHYLSVIGRLRPGITLPQAQSELDGLSRILQKEYATRAATTTAHLYSLKDDVVGSARGSLELIGGAVALMLLLVCVNIANLLLVRGSERAREFAMRSALGARRGRLIQQLLTESLVLACIGALLALPIARLVMAVIVKIGGDSIPRLDHLAFDFRVLGFSLAAAFGSALLFGLMPAWRAAATQPADVLRRSSRSATGDRAQGRLRSLLVTAQVALAFLLLVGAGLLLASFRALSSVPLGIKPDNVLTFQVHLPEARYDSLGRTAFHDRFDHAIAALAGVRATGASSRLPVAGSYNDWGVAIQTGPLVGTRQAQAGGEQRIVTPGYFNATGIRLVAGRLFTDADNAAASPHFILSRKAAQLYFGKESALGQRVESGGQTGEVVGVVDDVAIDPEGDAPPTMYRPHDQFAGDRNWSLFQAVATRGPADAMLPAIHRLLAEIDPQLVMDQTATMTNIIGRGTAQRAFALEVLLAFAITALFLAALGVFGVLSYTVRLRSPEFGLRMALGATPGMIRFAVLRSALAVTAVGILVGLAGALAFSRVMQSLVFHVSTLDPAVLAVAALFMAVIAALAGYLPARKATAVDPRTVLG